MQFITGWRMKHRQMFYAPLLPDRPYCFDIGANHDEYTAAFLSLGARVVAVEPQASCIKFIDAAFSEEVTSGRVVTRSAAVGAGQGKAELFIGPDPARSMSSLSAVFVDTSRANGQKWDIPPIEVELITLDSLIAELGVPDYVKIDVEGFDLEVLRGLSQPVNLVSFEFNTQPPLIDTAAGCIKRLQELGHYEFNYQVEAPNETSLQFDRWVDACVMVYTLRHDLARQPSFGDIFARRVCRMQKGSVEF